MTKDEALKMAIEALINSLTIQDVAINACQEALEQPKEKKYLYVYRGLSNVGFSKEKMDFLNETILGGVEALGYFGKIEVQND